MNKTSFSHDIGESFADCFEKLCQELGPPKYRILETAIEVFDSLPSNTQHLLKGYNQEQREVIYQILGTVRLDSVEMIKDLVNRWEIPDKDQELFMKSLRKTLEPEPPQQGKKRKHG